MARTRITKAEKQALAKRSEWVDILKACAHQVSEVTFMFPGAKNQARVAHDALVELAQAVGKVREPVKAPAGPIPGDGE